MHLFAVADGHGTFGHDVSTYVKHRMPVILGYELLKIPKTEADEIHEVSKALRETFLQLHNNMGVSEISSMSGTTCCAVLIKGCKVFAANVGDSRAIAVNQWGVVTALTID